MKNTKRLAAVALFICISLSALTGLITPANAANVDTAEFNSKLASFKAENMRITQYIKIIRALRAVTSALDTRTN